MSVSVNKDEIINNIVSKLEEDAGDNAGLYSTRLLRSLISDGLEKYLEEELSETTYVSHSLHEKLLNEKNDEIRRMSASIKILEDEFNGGENPKTLYLYFFKWTSHSSAFGKVCEHNCVADYRDHPAFIGYKKIIINMENLKK